MKYKFFLLSLLLSCVHESNYKPQEPSEVEQLAIDVVYEYCTSSDCEKPVEVIHAKTPEEYAYQCNSDVNKSAGCADIFNGRIITAPGYEDNLQLIIHEATHFLQFANQNGYVDYDHSNKKYWSSVGGSESIQYKSEQELQRRLEGRSELDRDE